MKTTIIGHRGAAGSTLENTIASFQAAIAAGADAIELDIRKTADGVLVVCHDSDLIRIANQPLEVASLTAQKLRTVTLVDGKSKIPTLDEALECIGSIPVFIEIKSAGCTEALLATLDRHPKATSTIISFKLEELQAIRAARPSVRLYLNEQTKAIEAIQTARANRFEGVGLNFWLLNPLAYHMAHRAGLDIFVYTVNRRWYGRLIHLLYPSVSICTDFPEYFITRKRRRK